MFRGFIVFLFVFMLTGCVTSVEQAAPLSVSPDGRWLCEVTRKRLVQFAVDGKELHSWVYVHLDSLDDSSLKKRVFIDSYSNLFEMRFGFGPLRWSADSRYVAVRYAGELAVVDTKKWKRSVLSDGAIQCFAWCSDSTLAYATERSVDETVQAVLVKLDVAKKIRKPLIEMPPSSHSCSFVDSSWSPCGRYVVFSDSQARLHWVDTRTSQMEAFGGAGEVLQDISWARDSSRSVINCYKRETGTYTSYLLSLPAGTVVDCTAQFQTISHGALEFLPRWNQDNQSVMVSAYGDRGANEATPACWLVSPEPWKAIDLTPMLTAHIPKQWRNGAHIECVSWPIKDWLCFEMTNPTLNKQKTILYQYKSEEIVDIPLDRKYWLINRKGDVYVRPDTESDFQNRGAWHATILKETQSQKDEHGKNMKDNVGNSVQIIRGQ